jgi:hypothetical protein
MALTLLFSILACDPPEKSTPLLMTIDFMEYESEGTTQVSTVGTLYAV